MDRILTFHSNYGVPQARCSETADQNSAWCFRFTDKWAMV